jgi:hypothetical protein
MNRALLPLLALLVVALGAPAQENVPILSGALGIVGTNTAANPSFQPIIAPVLVAPFGDHWVVEARGYIEGFIFRQDGTSGPYTGLFFAGLDYAQVDYIANRHLTITAGRFLTPFNIYNERFPLWIANLADSPIIYTIGTRISGSSNGGMVRGVAVERQNWIVNYTAYASAFTSTENLLAGRAIGGRAGVFVPAAGVEIGASYQRFLQSGDYNNSGMYFVWQPPPIPLDVRGEYAHSPGGQGYWMEGAYHLAPTRDTNSWLGRLQPVARVQQYFKGSNPKPEDILPRANTNQFDFGLNYYLPHDVRINGSYGRAFSSAGNYNTWNFSVTYRFLFPAWPGGH